MSVMNSRRGFLAVGCAKAAPSCGMICLETSQVMFKACNCGYYCEEVPFRGPCCGCKYLSKSFSLVQRREIAAENHARCTNISAFRDNSASDTMCEHVLGPRWPIMRSDYSKIAATGYLDKV